jgi:hypothetical protein
MFGRVEIRYVRSEAMRAFDQVDVISPLIVFRGIVETSKTAWTSVCKDLNCSTVDIVEKKDTIDER